LASFDKRHDWVALSFEFEGQIYVGWQKKGMLHAVLGVDFHAGEKSWVNEDQSSSKGGLSSPMPEPRMPEPPTYILKSGVIDGMPYTLYSDNNGMADLWMAVAWPK